MPDFRFGPGTRESVCGDEGMVEASVCSALSHYRITNAESMRLLIDAGARIEEKDLGADDDGAVLEQKLADLEEIAFRPQCASPANGGSAPCGNTKEGG